MILRSERMSATYCARNRAEADLPPSAPDRSVSAVGRKIIHTGLVIKRRCSVQACGKQRACTLVFYSADSSARTMYCLRKAMWIYGNENRRDQM